MSHFHKELCANGTLKVAPVFILTGSIHFSDVFKGAKPTTNKIWMGLMSITRWISICLLFYFIILVTNRVDPIQNLLLPRKSHLKVSQFKCSK